MGIGLEVDIVGEDTALEEVDKRLVGTDLGVAYILVPFTGVAFDNRLEGIAIKVYNLLEVSYSLP